MTFCLHSSLAISLSIFILHCNITFCLLSSLTNSLTLFILHMQYHPLLSFFAHKFSLTFSSLFPWTGTDTRGTRCHYSTDPCQSPLNTGKGQHIQKQYDIKIQKSQWWYRKRSAHTNNKIIWEYTKWQCEYMNTGKSKHTQSKNMIWKYKKY